MRSQQKLNDALTSLDNSTKEIARVQGLNTKLQQQLLASSDTIAALAKQNISEVTGGDSFCYVEMGTVPRDFMASVVRKGKYPLFDVHVTITDLNALDTGKPTSVNTRTFPKIDLVRGLSHRLGLYPEDPKVEYKRFNIEISARNGYFTHLLRIKNLKERGWTWATLVNAGYFTGKKGIVLEEIHPEFPKDILNDDTDWINLKKVKVIKVAE